jgi:Chaperone of endosialidase
MRINLLSPKQLLFAGLVFLAIPASAQLHVTAAGDVGIGTTTPIGKLQVSNAVNPYTLWTDDFNTTLGYKYGIVNQMFSPKGGSTTGMYNYSSTASGANPPGWDYTVGIQSTADGGQGYVYGISNYAYQFSCAEAQGYGIYNYLYTDSKYEGYGIYNYTYAGSTCGSAAEYGIYNELVPNTNPGSVNYGIYSNTPGAGNYAGYFDGNVHVNGTFTVMSDERKKQDVAPLRGAMALVSRMNGYTYSFKADANANLPEGKQFGFLAQELAQVVPDLVADGKNPLHTTQSNANSQPKPLTKGETPKQEKRADIGTEDIKAVNYIGVIPILVEAMKEQQAQLEAQRMEIESLRNELNKK